MRAVNNTKIIKSLRSDDDDDGGEAHRLTCAEAAEGRMAEPAFWKEWMIPGITLIRRFAVDELEFIVDGGSALWTIALRQSFRCPHRPSANRQP